MTELPIKTWGDNGLQKDWVHDVYYHLGLISKPVHILDGVNGPYIRH